MMRCWSCGHWNEYKGLNDGGMRIIVCSFCNEEAVYAEPVENYDDEGYLLPTEDELELDGESEWDALYDSDDEA